MRADLERTVADLLAATPRGGDVSLDALGDALGTTSVTLPEIEAVVDAIEGAGRTVGGAAADGTPGQGVERLRRVVDVARALRSELGRAPTPGEIAARAHMALDAVRHALALARVMQR